MADRDIRHFPQKLREVIDMAGDVGESIPELPLPIASNGDEGRRQAREIIGRYLPNFAMVTASIALGPETGSAHTRWQAVQCGLAIYELAPEPLPKIGRSGE